MAVHGYALDREAHRIQFNLGNVVPVGRNAFVHLPTNLAMVQVKPQMRADIL